ncbi:FadR/GntR family transcriptional regulator [Cohnella nanjingensis]|uniref:FadR family transcriptional regulator n=1 Tax=Cohnella nanjingensis TaxID=1387779 RepID=A0A7X0RVC5_9BACL|nr:FadR/GntR family transcriptional regulator [Cohnella nanjingensis]MBB6672784.1 FadR family transcriptional regulator [Cohnella nanjingensis]
MEATRLTKRNHYEEMTEHLKRQILEGKLQVGDKLPSTKEISERFGVGRSTTREALSALKAMGLIEIRQGGGCRVIRSAPAETVPEIESLRVNRETLLELLEVRQTLELSIAAIAASRRTDEDVDALRRVVQEMAQAIGDDLEGERTDLLFHLSLARATGNAIMVRLFESITGQMERAIREVRRVELYANRSVAERLFREHEAIARAVANREPQEATARMSEHLRHVESILTKHL